MGISSTVVLPGSRTLLASGDEHGGFSVQDTDRQKLILKVQFAESVIRILFSPDAEYVMVASSQRFSVISIGQKRILWTRGPCLNGVPSLEWDPTSTKLLSEQGTIYEVAGTQYSQDHLPSQEIEEKAASHVYLPSGCPIFSPVSGQTS